MNSVGKMDEDSRRRIPGLKKRQLLVEAEFAGRDLEGDGETDQWAYSAEAPLQPLSTKMALHACNIINIINIINHDKK